MWTKLWFAPEGVQRLSGSFRRYAGISLCREGAAVLFLGRRDHFEIFLGSGNRRARGEDVPLIIDLVSGQCGYRIHLVHELVIASTEVALPCLEQVKLRTLLEVFDDLRRVGRFQLVDRLRYDFGRDVIAPSLVLRRLTVFLCERRDEILAAGCFD